MLPRWPPASRADQTSRLISAAMRDQMRLATQIVEKRIENRHRHNVSSKQSDDRRLPAPQSIGSCRRRGRSDNVKRPHARLTSGNGRHQDWTETIAVGPLNNSVVCAPCPAGKPSRVIDLKMRFFFTTPNQKHKPRPEKMIHGFDLSQVTKNFHERIRERQGQQDVSSGE